MSAYAIFDVDISDMAKYREFRAGVKPRWNKPGRDSSRAAASIGSTKATGRRAGLFSWSFRRSKRSKTFYHGETYRSLKSIRDACSSGPTE